mmetsp:Transcript_8139/g.20017  ORF Transcript_8139/g.20017 Transcript_8139/m.20017 type:complete len:103 (-) Transcript_8139:1840-2148(-)
MYHYVIAKNDKYEYSMGSRLRLIKISMFSALIIIKLEVYQIVYPSHSLKKSSPLSSTTMNAGKSSTSIFQTASIPSSLLSNTSTFLMQFLANIAAGPPMLPK